MLNAAMRLISSVLALAILTSMPAKISIAHDGNGTTNADNLAVHRQLQEVIDTYVAKRADTEGISGVSLRVDVGTRHPVIAVVSVPVRGLYESFESVTGVGLIRLDGL